MKTARITTTCPICKQQVTLNITVHTQTALPEALNLFTPETAKHLQITHQDNEKIIITPKHYLGKQLFHQIAKQVKQLGGNYVSQGKNSYFWIPTTQQPQTTSQTPLPPHSEPSKTQLKNQQKNQQAH